MEGRDMEFYLRHLFAVGMMVAATGTVFNANCAEDRLSIFAEENVLPYTFIDNGVMKGTDYDIMMEAAKRMNIRIDIKFMPWKRMKIGVERGLCDAGISFFYVKEREEFGIYSYPPLHYSTYVIFVRKGHEFPFASIEDLYGKTVGKTRGYSISEEFDKAVAEGRISVEEVTRNLQNIKKVAAGRLDCMVSNLDTTLIGLKRNGFADELVPLREPIKEAKGAHLVFSKAGKNIADKNAFVARFNSVLEKMKEDGTLQKIYASYLK